ncbi:hypothetical protein [Ulvibacterium marinum]|uniref:Lipoprotein n=1 Tax=Ulvibacterium marinum TaxID=2419782 RepID=A0A3B0C906_9FLAO|nr:hypothetical protein [Ulvibacterium marinum]RKN82765.1 hypothetical protein D7Z94_02685 [Ulvibacterium marinum]
MNFKVLIFISFSVTACSFNKNWETTSCVDRFINQELGNSFEISLRLKIEKDDVLELYFIEEQSVNSFHSDKKIRQKVLGDSLFQEIRFELPERVVPVSFRIDLGENTQQKEVSITEIKLKYKQNVIQIKDSLIPYFFVPNEYLKLKGNSGRFGFVEKKNRRDPFIISHPVLNKKIKIEF